MPGDRSSNSKRPQGKRSGPPKGRGGPAKRSVPAKGRGGSKRPANRSGGGARTADNRGSGGPRKRADRGPRRPAELTDDEIQRRKAMANWGSVARKGARNVTQERNDIDRDLLPPEKPWEFRDDGVPRHKAEEFRDQVETAVERARVSQDAPPARDRGILRPRTPIGLDTALKRAFGADQVKRNRRRIDDAAEEFTQDHAETARKILRPLLERGAGVAEIRELSGLINYRLGKWDAAIDDLETFRELTGSAEQHPVLADCHRALGRWNDVEALWLELGEQSPSAELVTEGRIVTAGALADRGRLSDAVRTLEKGWKAPKRPGDHHLRRAYALADLYERSGATVKARQLFGWIDGHDKRFADVGDRLRQLG